MIGLNPPFGVNGVLASKFIEHAASFEPRVILLIAPSCTPVPSGYRIYLEDCQLCSDRYIFGSMLLTTDATYFFSATSSEIR